MTNLTTFLTTNRIIVSSDDNDDTKCKKDRLMNKKTVRGILLSVNPLKVDDHKTLGLQEYHCGMLAHSIIIKSSRPQEVLRTYQGYRPKIVPSHIPRDSVYQG